MQQIKAQLRIKSSFLMARPVILQGQDGLPYTSSITSLPRTEKLLLWSELKAWSRFSIRSWATPKRLIEQPSNTIWSWLPTISWVSVKPVSTSQMITAQRPLGYASSLPHFLRHPFFWSARAWFSQTDQLSRMIIYPDPEFGGVLSEDLNWSTWDMLYWVPQSSAVSNRFRGEMKFYHSFHSFFCLEELTYSIMDVLLLSTWNLCRLTVSYFVHSKTSSTAYRR